MSNIVTRGVDTFEINNAYLLKLCKWGICECIKILSFFFYEYSQCMYVCPNTQPWIGYLMYIIRPIHPTTH